MDQASDADAGVCTVECLELLSEFSFIPHLGHVGALAGSLEDRGFPALLLVVLTSFGSFVWLGVFGLYHGKRGKKRTSDGLRPR